MQKITRTGYTLLDLLSDIGGIQGLLISLFSAVVGFLNKSYFDDQMVAKLYKYQSSKKLN